jgi:hypothetical protein
VSHRQIDPYALSRAERERQETWAVMAQLALRRGAGAMLPGKFPPDVEADYQALRAQLEAMRAADEAGQLDLTAHEQLRERARALLARLGQG